MTVNPIQTFLELLVSSSARSRRQEAGGRKQGRYEDARCARVLKIDIVREIDGWCVARMMAIPRVELRSPHDHNRRPIRLSSRKRSEATATSSSGKKELPWR